MEPLDYATPPLENERNPPERRVKFGLVSAVLFAVAIWFAKASIDLIHPEWPITTIPFVPIGLTVSIIAAIFGAMALYQTTRNKRRLRNHREPSIQIRALPSRPNEPL